MNFKKNVVAFVLILGGLSAVILVIGLSIMFG